MQEEPGLDCSYGFRHQSNGRISFAYGSDCVIAVDDARLNGIQDEIEANVLVRLIRKYKPEVVLCAATTKEGL